jgi:hypothetical protein
MSSNLNQYLFCWLEKIEANIDRFRNQPNQTPDDKIEFITHQYHLVMLIYRALNGQVIFVGAKPINE